MLVCTGEKKVCMFDFNKESLLQVMIMFNVNFINNLASRCIVDVASDNNPLILFVFSNRN